MTADRGRGSTERTRKDDWLASRYAAATAKHPERKERYSTLSDEPIDPLYTPDDLAGFDPRRDLGLPGEFPYTRGVHPSMYRGRLWTMRQFAGFGSADDTNRRFHYLLQHGVTGLSVAFDMPTLMGRDADDPLSRGEVGREGVAVSSLADMEILFDRIPVGEVTTSMTINGPASIVWAMYLAAAEKQGVPLTRLGGTIQNDALKEYIAQREWIVPVKPAMDLVVDTFRFGSREVPRWNTISVSGYHIREAGATALQELAFTLIDGLEYVKWGVAAGLDVNEFVPRISFFFDVHNDFFEEIAKFRAARRIWAREMQKRYAPTNERALMLRTHAQTAGVSLTAQQPHNNVVRVALQALAAVLGGTNSLHTNSLDETYALPTEEAVTLALRTQQIIAHESGVADTVDPLAGSYYLEALTDRMELGFHRYLETIEGLGGMVEAVERGYPQREITESAFHFQQQVDEGEKVIVGINKHVVAEDVKIPRLAIDPDVERRQIERLADVRAKRDAGRWHESIQRLRDAARARGELMPAFLDCARAYASVGEQVEVLKEVYGVYRDPAYF
ncbi:MAG: acyl-CoA mutase large subunit family protein [Candidatus Limnocylindria bacterium]|nr:methylmalonyl-CoA mutase family protein [Chloroflexota bacterium]MDQ3400988.1 methylmalonyl-CoA mutase family protein [Chloroflexota bacterium]